MPRWRCRAVICFFDAPRSISRAARRSSNLQRANMGNARSCVVGSIDAPTTANAAIRTCSLSDAHSSTACVPSHKEATRPVGPLSGIVGMRRMHCNIRIRHRLCDAYSARRGRTYAAIFGQERKKPEADVRRSKSATADARVSITCNNSILLSSAASLRVLLSVLGPFAYTPASMHRFFPIYHTELFSSFPSPCRSHRPSHSPRLSRSLWLSLMRIINAAN